MRTFGNIAIAISLIFTITACSHLSRNESIPPPEILADCFIDFYLSAWNDMDGDGTRELSEPSLEGVEFHIDGRFASLLSKYPCISNEDGKCIIRTWAPGKCAGGNYTITTISPKSFEPTTPASITLTLPPVVFSGEAQFGFNARLK